MTRTRSSILLVTAAALLSACAGARSPAGVLRFHNREPVWVVHDRHDVPKKPEERKFFRAYYHLDGFWYGRFDRWMQMRRETRATNVNSLDEVPDSTWFTNRIGMRPMTPEEIATGPNVTGSPDAHKPWIVKSSKVGGITVGFIIKDQRGKKYVLKFDVNGIPEMETASDVIQQRLLWAAGYNVPEDYIVTLKRSDLVLADDAVVKDPMGNETPMTDEFIDRQLALINVEPDGSIRGLASQFIPGIPIGGHDRDGVRPDDPNDSIPHQHRRELRGLYPIYSWLDQPDVKEDNTLDTWAEDPADAKVHYVVHFLLDFGKGLGVMPFINGRTFIGFDYLIDWKAMGRQLFTLGLWPRPWEGRRPPPIRGVGLYDAVNFDPGKWKPYTPSYFPFHDVDRFDAFWGAKILIRFTEEHLRAAIAQAHFSDRRAADYMTAVMIERQRKVARYWFSRVNPLDQFEAEEDQDGWTLCFDDLTILYNLEQSLTTQTRYGVRLFDYDGKPTGHEGYTFAQLRGRTCIGGLPHARGPDDYTIVEIRTRRRGFYGPPVLVHVARAPGSGKPRVIGLRRL